MIRRLRKRFIRIATLSVAAVMLALSLIVNAANFISTDSDLTRMVNIICENRGSIPIQEPPKDAAPEQDGSLPAVRRLEERGDPFNQEAPYATRYFTLCYSADGTLLSTDFSHIAAITDSDSAEFLAVAQKHGTGFGYYANYKFCVVETDEGNMAVFLDCYQELRSIRTLAVCSFAAMGVCIALVYVLIVFFSRRAIDPVVRSAQRQKQFITDASHELKTPITVIATSLKVLEMEVGQQKWIDKARVQTERLKELVNSLVTLSRMDEEESPLRPERFAVSESLAETAESFADYAASQGHALHLAIAPGLRFCGDEYALRQLVSILLDNAVKYAADGSPIEFSLQKSRRGLVIRTANACEPIAPEELDRLFDRFYRADKARSSSAGGFGIGLSVARSIAEGHGGTIRARCPSPGQIEFIVRLK